MRNITLAFVLGFMCILSLSAQTEPTWDNTTRKNWNSAFQEVEITSSKDGNIQKAFLYKSKRATPQPLIVSLHTWSGNYTQSDPLTKEILARDWNYIHPDFRGPNRTPSAMGSPLALADIEDAIRYALEQTHANPDEVHIVGVSGGGYATLAAFMNVDYPVKSFSAWVPISDIEAWYWESVGRSAKYANDILSVVAPDTKVFNRETALLRSPLYQSFPTEKRKDSQLYIYTGIHDGYTGSVPITHSMKMYNRLVGELKYGLSDINQIMEKSSSDPDLISCNEMLELLGKCIDPDCAKNPKLFDRNVHLARSYGNIHLTVFEGRHEQLPQALGLVPCALPESNLKCKILTIGDSNGAIKGGWTDRLKKMMPQATIVNLSQSGRTIGFDNNGKAKLNALKNIDSYLDSALTQHKQYDFIIVCLGTNDTKKVFDDRQSEVPQNLSALLAKIKKHKLYRRGKTRLVYVTPPPLRQDNVLEKYEDSGKRLIRLVPQLKEVAKQQGFEVVDIHQPLLGIIDYYAEDGVHMKEPGQDIVASLILSHISQKK